MSCFSDISLGSVEEPEQVNGKNSLLDESSDPDIDLDSLLEESDPNIEHDSLLDESEDGDIDVIQEA